MGNMATLITNSSDFSSRARTPSAAVWPQLIALPAGFIVTSLIGILIASASVPLYGELEWDVLELLNRFLDGSPSGSTRFGGPLQTGIYLVSMLMRQCSSLPRHLFMVSTFTFFVLF